MVKEKVEKKKSSEQNSEVVRPGVVEREKKARQAIKSPTSSAEDVERKKTKIAEASCADKDCHVHGNLKARGRVFEGKVIKKFPKRIAIEFERMIYVRKYERYAKLKTKIHARLPVCMENEINLGDLVKIQECRPLSKIIHFVVIGKVNTGDKKQ